MVYAMQPTATVDGGSRGSVALSTHIELASTTVVKLQSMLDGYSGTMLTGSRGQSSGSALFATKIG